MLLLHLTLAASPGVLSLTQAGGGVGIGASVTLPWVLSIGRSLVATFSTVSTKVIASWDSGVGGKMRVSKYEKKK